MRILRPMVAGTLLSMAATGILAYLDQGPVTSLPPLSWRHPLTSYWALAGAPLGNGAVLFLLTAFIFFMCFLIWGRERQ
jgi:hypothetical protein